MTSSSSQRVFIVGAGPVAVALAGGLRSGGVRVAGLWARREDRAQHAADSAGVDAHGGPLAELTFDAETVILAVRDDAIADVAKQLVGAGIVDRAHIILHCAGSQSSKDAFADIREQVGGIGVLHPLRSIVDGAVAMSSMAGTTFGVEGDEPGLMRSRSLALALGGRVLELHEGRVAAYHAAAAMVSNYLVALVDVALELLESAGVSRDEGTAALLPLASGTLSNLEERGLPAALTGPIRRGDVQTVERHLAALAGLGPLADIYRSLGRRALNMSRSLGDASSADLERIAGLLTHPGR